MKEQEKEELAYQMIKEQSSKDYMNSGSFSASATGIDGIPHVRFGEIAKLMVKFTERETRKTT